MFRALLAHPQEVLQKRHLYLRACYISWLHQFHFNPGAAN
jgi:hypothetical protein